MEFFEKAWPFTESSDGIFTQKLAAEKNRLRILGLIARRKCLSQRQLATTTRLQPSTVSNIVRSLKESGIIREGAPIEADRVGPKEMELELVASAAWSIGLNLDALKHRLVVVNAMGHVLTQESLPPGLPVDELGSILPDTINDLATRLGLDPSKLAGIGVSVPGAVNADTGVVLVSRSLNLSRYPLREKLEHALGHPIWVERNVACGAYAEYQIGAARDRDSFVYFLLRSSPGQPDTFGLALVIGEKIFHGCNSAAGEVDSNIMTAPTALAPDLQNDANVAAFYQAYANGIAGIINLLDVSCLVLCSNDDRLTRSRFDQINQTIQTNLIPVPDRRFDFLRSGMGIEGMTLGSALLALHRGLAAQLGRLRKNPPETAV
jgi:predicted NBD/HSP70 family sugar kinase